MATKRHKIFNFAIILIPWLSVLFIGRRSLKRYSAASMIIVIYEIINHVVGHKKRWWKFYDRRKNFLRDELPFDIGPYMPMSLWILKYTFGDLKKYALVNAVANGLFTFIGMPILKSWKIIQLNRLSYPKFFFYIHYKSYILYAVQYLLEKWRPLLRSPW